MLERLRGFVFDLDGCIWNGHALNPGARDTLLALHAAGRRLAFISNNSRATGEELRARLAALGVSVAEHVLTPLEIIGRVIADGYGPSRVLVMGAEDPARGIGAARPSHRRLAIAAIEVADQRIEEAHVEDASKPSPQVPHFFCVGAPTSARRPSSAKEATTTSASPPSVAPPGA